MKKKVIGLYLLSIICFFISGMFGYKGYDKMTNYYNSEDYSILNENAYVGGDAYNYIINGTYSTSYFTLTSGFMISGVLCGVGGMIISAIHSRESEDSGKMNSIQMNEELPPL